MGGTNQSPTDTNEKDHGSGKTNFACPTSNSSPENYFERNKTRRKFAKSDTKTPSSKAGDALLDPFVTLGSPQTAPRKHGGLDRLVNDEEKAVLCLPCENTKCKEPGKSLTSDQLKIFEMSLDRICSEEFQKALESPEASTPSPLPRRSLPSNDRNEVNNAQIHPRDFLKKLEDSAQTKQ